MIEYTQEELFSLYKSLSHYHKEWFKETYKDHVVIESIRSKLLTFLIMFATGETTITITKESNVLILDLKENQMPTSSILNDRITKRITEWKDLYLIKLQSILFDTPHEELPRYIEDDQKEVSIIAAWRLGIGK